MLLPKSSRSDIISDMAFPLIVILRGFEFSGDWLQSLLLWYSPKYWPNNDVFTEEHIVLKMKFSIKDYFSKCDQIHSSLRIWSHLLKKSLMENFIFLCSGINRSSLFDYKIAPIMKGNIKNDQISRNHCT